jgi:hypothetical protein
MALQRCTRDSAIIAENEEVVGCPGLFQQPDVLGYDGKLCGRQPLTGNHREEFGGAHEARVPRDKIKGLFVPWTACVELGERHSARS